MLSLVASLGLVSALCSAQVIRDARQDAIQPKRVWDARHRHALHQRDTPGPSVSTTSASNCSSATCAGGCVPPTIQVTIQSVGVTEIGGYAGGPQTNVPPITISMPTLQQSSAQLSLPPISYVPPGGYPGPTSTSVSSPAPYETPQDSGGGHHHHGHGPIGSCRSMPHEYTSDDGNIYKVTCGADYPGNDIGVYSAGAFSNCFEICDDHPECEGFAYLGGSGPGNCYLKRAITGETAKSNVDGAIIIKSAPGRPESPAHPTKEGAPNSCRALRAKGDTYTDWSGRKYTVDCNYDYAGDDIGMASVPGFESCFGQCSKIPGCVAFAYLGGDQGGNCYFKNAALNGHTGSSDAGRLIPVGDNQPPVGYSTSQSTTPAAYTTPSSFAPSTTATSPSIYTAPSSQVQTTSTDYPGDYTTAQSSSSSAEHTLPTLSSTSASHYSTETSSSSVGSTTALTTSQRTSSSGPVSSGAASSSQASSSQTGTGQSSSAATTQTSDTSVTQTQSTAATSDASSPSSGGAPSYATHASHSAQSSGTALTSYMASASSSGPLAYPVPTYSATGSGSTSQETSAQSSAHETSLTPAPVTYTTSTTGTIPSNPPPQVSTTVAAYGGSSSVANSNTYASHPQGTGSGALPSYTRSQSSGQMSATAYPQSSDTPGPYPLPYPSIPLPNLTPALGSTPGSLPALQLPPFPQLGSIAGNTGQVAGAMPDMPSIPLSQLSTPDMLPHLSAPVGMLPAANPLPQLANAGNTPSIPLPQLSAPGSLPNLSASGNMLPQLANAGGTIAAQGALPQTLPAAHNVPHLGDSGNTLPSSNVPLQALNPASMAGSIPMHSVPNVMSQAANPANMLPASSQLIPMPAQAQSQAGPLPQVMQPSNLMSGSGTLSGTLPNVMPNQAAAYQPVQASPYSAGSSLPVPTSSPQSYQAPESTSASGYSGHETHSNPEQTATIGGSHHSPVSSSATSTPTSNGQDGNQPTAQAPYGTASQYQHSPVASPSNSQAQAQATANVYPVSSIGNTATNYVPGSTMSGSVSYSGQQHQPHSQGSQPGSFQISGNPLTSGNAAGGYEFDGHHVSKPQGWIPTVQLTPANPQQNGLSSLPGWSVTVPEPIRFPQWSVPVAPQAPQISPHPLPAHNGLFGFGGWRRFKA